ncbi:MAG: hypothetical protein K8R23_12040 [Chthoniobacter sp.]|nr:hypothetical protein [Chthoniobacter sp.]
MTTMFGRPINNPKNLRVVKTARTAQAINAAAKEGFRPLVKAVIPSPDVHCMIAVFQHRETGEVKLSGDCRWGPGAEYDLVVPYTVYYPYRFPEPFAAYLLTPDLAEGERVWLDDVIKDIVAVYGNQEWHPRLEACEAIWINGDFVIDFDSSKAPRLIG